MDNNVVELNAGKSKIGFEEASFIENLKTRATSGIVTTNQAIEAFWASAGSLKDDLFQDGENAVIEVETEIIGLLPTFTHLFRRAGVSLLADKQAVTSLEYGIIASILGLVLVATFGQLGAALKTVFSHVGASI